eukprot:756830-Hanusia_phi.AAC.2
MNAQHGELCGTTRGKGRKSKEWGKGGRGGGAREIPVDYRGGWVMLASFHLQWVEVGGVVEGSDGGCSKGELGGRVVLQAADWRYRLGASALEVVFRG